VDQGIIEEMIEEDQDQIQAQEEREAVLHILQ